VVKEKEKVKKDEYQKALTAYNQAMKTLRKKEYENAAELLTEFMKKYASEKELVDRTKIYLSICQAKQKKEKISLKTFDDYYQYSVFRMNQGNYEEALKLLEKAWEMQPKDGRIPYLMASTYCLMGQNEECLEYLKRAIQLDKYFKILAQNEVDFEPVKEDKKFKMITRMS